MLPKGILFDMDGCLINSEVVYFNAWLTLFQEKDIPIGKEQVETWKGLGWKRIRDKILTVCPNPADVDSLYKERDKIFYKRLYQNEVEYMPGVLEFLDYLDKKGVVYGIATSTYREKASNILRHMNLLDRMQIVVCGDEVPDTKPSPDIYLEAAKQLGIPTEELIVFEDSRNGVLSALAADLKVIQILNEEDYEEFANVEFTIRNYIELIEKW